MNTFIDLWTGHTDFSFVKMLLIGSFFLLIDAALFLAFWYARYQIALELGFPKRKKKGYLKKRTKDYTVFDRLFLVRPSFCADAINPLTFLNFIFHCANIVSFILSIVGYVGCLITTTDGWCIMLLISSVLSVNAVSFGIEFIPDLIWFPAERRRYKFWK